MESLTEDGVRLAWLDMAVRWAIPARRLIESHNFLDVQLGYVALHLTVNRASMLVNGYTDRVTGMRVAPDPIIVGDCPMDPRRLQNFAERTERIRDQIMHLADGLEPGRGIGLNATRGKVSISVVGKGGRQERMTEREALGMLDAIEPWLRRHRDRVMARPAMD
jgi:hypothetical protein